MEILRAQVETVEVVGLDEAYLDLSGLSYPKATMRRIASEIRERTGLTCSIGIAENKLLGKIASELAKPAGLVRLGREEALERFASSSPGLIPGIGPKTLERLERLGIRTLADLQAPRSGEPSRRASGERSGAWLHRRARFEDESPVALARETKSQSSRDHLRHRRLRCRRDGGFAGAALRSALPAAAEPRAARGAASGSRSASTIGPTSAVPGRSEHPTNDPVLVGRVARELLREYSPPRPVRLLGVRVAAFGDGGPGPRARRPAALGAVS